jgi:hypothetical protein
MPKRTSYFKRTNEIGTFVAAACSSNDNSNRHEIQHHLTIDVHHSMRKTFKISVVQVQCPLC